MYGCVPIFLHVALVCPTYVCVWSQLIARRALGMNDGRRPSQTVESSPVNVGYLKTDGHLEAIGVQLQRLDTPPRTHTWP